MFIELTSAASGDTVIVNTEMIEQISRIKNCDRTAITFHHHTLEVKEDVFDIVNVWSRNSK